jgi:hypothetical protein
MILTKSNDETAHFFWNTKKIEIDEKSEAIKKAIKNCELEFINLTGVQNKAAKQTELMNKALTDLEPSLTAGVAETGNFEEAQKKLASNVEISKKAITRWKGVVNGLKGTLKSVGGSLIQFGVNLAISAALTYAMNKFHEASQKMEEAAERARQVSEQSEELADTKQQVIELKSKLDDVNTTESEAVSIRKQLYDIQEKLIEQYGDEKVKIDLVRDSVETLSTAFGNLNASQLKATYEENPTQYSDALNNIYGKSNNPTSNIGHKRFVFDSSLPSTSNGYFQNTLFGNTTYIVPEYERDTETLNNVYEKVGEYLEQKFEGFASYEYDTNNDKSSLTFNADEYFKEFDYSRNEIVNAYEDIISYLTNERLNSDETEKMYLDAFIKEFTAVKNKIADDKYKNDIDLANTYAQYLLTNKTEYDSLNIAYQAMMAAQNDYEMALVKGNKDEIADATANLNYAKDELEKILKNKNIVNSATQDGQAIIDFVQTAINTINLLTSNTKTDEVSKIGESLDFTPILDMNTEAMKKWSEEIDNVQSSFDAIKGVFTDYNKTGVLSIDNLQKLLALDSEYIKLMFDENGNLTLNKQAYEDLTKAKLESIKLDVLRNAIDNIKQITDEASAQEWLATQTNKATEATAGYTEELLKQYTVTAKLKGGNVEKAVTGIYENYKNLITLIDATTTSFDDNTDAVNKQIKALEDEKKQQEIVKKSLEVQKSALEDLSKEYEDAQGKINSLVDLTVDMLKQKYEDEKEIIEKQKDAYKDKVDTLKEALDEEKDAYDKHQSILEKTNDISTLQRQALSLQGNTSVEGKQRLAEIQKELAESTQDLYDTQYENSVNDRQNALDKEYERKEQLWDKEIERIDEVVSNERQLRIEAMNLIDTRSNKFYNDLWSYVYEYTTKSRFEFDTLWTEAYNALDEYNFGQLTCLQIMDFLQRGIYNTSLQIDTLIGQISGVSGAIDSISISIDNLAKSLENLPDNIDLGGNDGDEFEGVEPIAPYNNWENWKPGTYDPTKTNIYDEQVTATFSKTKPYYYFTYEGVDYAAPRGHSKEKAIDYIYKILPTRLEEYEIWKGLSSRYAKGTLSAKGGLSIVDEEGSELILSQPQKGRYANLGEGSVVFTKDQTKNLWELSKLSDPPKKLMDAYNKFKDMYVKNGNNFFVNKSNESYLSGIRGNSSITTNSVTNSNNRSITAPINITVHNANGLNEKKLATNIKTEIFREFRRYSSWLG